MSIAKRIAAITAERERKVIEVPEWGEGGNPLRLYSYPTTGRDMDKMGRKHPEFPLVRITWDAMIDFIIIKCQDEDGNQAFTLEDKPILKDQDNVVTARVFGETYLSKSVEEHEKN